MADKKFLVKQKFLLEILHHIHEPLMFDEWKKMSSQLVLDKSMYLKFTDEMIKFIDLIKLEMFLPKGEIFTVFNKIHLEQAKGLFMMFYYAKDWETFVRNVCYARVYFNEGLFVYALNLTIYHRHDMRGLVLPSMAEIWPEMFFNGKFITDCKTFDIDLWKIVEMMSTERKEFKKAEFKWMDINDEKWSWWERKWHLLEDKQLLREKFFEWQRDPKWMEMMKDMKMFWMKVDYCGDFKTINEECKLTYLTEDIDWNMYWYYLNMEYPFWMEGKYFDDKKEFRGELWMFNIQQLLARFYMERLSHGMGEIEKFSWYKPIKMGYSPELMDHKGLRYTERDNYWKVDLTEEYDMLNIIEDFERRIRDVVDRGFYIMVDGTKVDLFKTDYTNFVGNMIQGNPDSLDRKFFGCWMMVSHMFLGGGDLKSFKSNISTLMPNVYLNFETMMRDPLFYMLYKRVTDVFYRYKYQFGSYKKYELLFNGVKIEDVTVDKMVTYFDWVDTDVSTLLNPKMLFKDGKFTYDKMLTARQMRLNHKPFAFHFNITSDKARKVVIRSFLGPKFDEFGRKLKLDVNRKNFMEIDQFMYELTIGKNMVKRTSEEFFWTRKDRTTYTELYKRVALAMEGKCDWQFEMPVGGFPDRLVLPRGWVEGMPMQMFFIITPFDVSMKEYTIEEHKYSYGKRFDKLPFGFPFDREIDELEFYVPNMYMTDVEIFHNKDVHKDMKFIRMDKNITH